MFAFYGLITMLVSDRLRIGGCFLLAHHLGEPMYYSLPPILLAPPLVLLSLWVVYLRYLTWDSGSILGAEFRFSSHWSVNAPFWNVLYVPWTSCSLYYHFRGLSCASWWNTLVLHSMGVSLDLRPFARFLITWNFFPRAWIHISIFVSHTPGNILIYMVASSPDCSFSL